MSRLQTLKPAPAADAQDGETVQLAIAAIRVGPSNPRQRFPEESLRELAASFQAYGVLQAVIVRPLGPGEERGPRAKGKPAGRQRFELVCGERRLKAAALAGLSSVPATIRAFSDREALEAQILENEQREDLTPLEKAEGYRRLIEEHGVELEELALRVGRSPSAIRDLLRLLDLPEKAKEFVQTGVLPAYTGRVIAGVPERLRDECLRRVLSGTGDGPAPTWAELRPEAKAEWPRVCTYKQARDLAEKLYMVELKQAPFDRRAIDLVPGVGSCQACPKRAGNNPQEFAGLRGDICTDPECYRGKCEAHAAMHPAEGPDEDLDDGQAVAEPRAETRRRSTTANEHLNKGDWFKGRMSLAEVARRTEAEASTWDVNVDLVQALVGGLLGAMPVQAASRVLIRRGGQMEDLTTPATGLAAIAGKMTAAELFGLLAELAACHALEGDGDNGQDSALLAYLRSDRQPAMT